MIQQSLFEPEVPPFRSHLADKLRRLASQGVFIGTSSWKYEGWLGQIYSEERYRVRGRFSQRLFEQTCLAEYAETFPVVCGDFAFYQFPTAEFWHKLFASAPGTLRFAFKVPEEITVKAFPMHARYGERGGLDNPNFLSAETFARLFVEPLLPYRERVAALIFEFGAFSRKSYAEPLQFLADLDLFLGQLPAGFRYATEIRNADFFGPDYLLLLRDHGVAHTFNSWTRMPELPDQVSRADAFTTDYFVCRALLRQGRRYEDAVRMFQPYASVQEEYRAGRAGLRQLIAVARETGRQGLIFVNNRLEGNAPQTIAAVVDGGC